MHDDHNADVTDRNYEKGCLKGGDRRSCWRMSVIEICSAIDTKIIQGE